VVPLLEPINKTVRRHKLLKLSRFIIRIDRMSGIRRFNRKKTEVCAGEKLSFFEKFSADSVAEYHFLGISECSSSLRKFWSIGTL
jgi:hypothetical protein